MNDSNWTPREARMHLAEYAQWVSRRDEYVLRAYRARLSLTEIANLTGHARQTIGFIIIKGESPNE